MPATWPLSLQQKINVDGFSVTFGNTVVRSDSDVGPAKVRSRFTDAVDSYATTINLDYSDFQTFKDFFKTTLANGSLTFNFNDPMTGTSAVFRFQAPPDIKPIGGRVFQIGMNWEKLP